MKTGGYVPETRETVEYLVNQNSDLKLGIIDTPGLNDPRGIKQDACNLNSMLQFFKTHPLYSNSECYPNLIFIVLSASEHRIAGSGSKLANTLHALKELKLVDRYHPNVVAVLTFCCSVNYNNVLTWTDTMQEKKTLISRNIRQVLGIEAPVVLLENDNYSNDLKKSGNFTLLPNGERQPENLLQACRKVLKGNGDSRGLSTFDAGFAQQSTKKKYQLVAHHKVMANDSSKKPISQAEQHLLNILRGSAEDGKLSTQLYLILLIPSVYFSSVPWRSRFFTYAHSSHIWH